jgi:hypothetical protein
MPTPEMVFKIRDFVLFRSLAHRCGCCCCCCCCRRRRCCCCGCGCAVASVLSSSAMLKLATRTCRTPFVTPSPACLTVPLKTTPTPTSGWIESNGSCVAESSSASAQKACGKAPLFFEPFLILCLSRACLGKLIVFSIKMAQKRGVFRTVPPPSNAVAADPSRMLTVSACLSRCGAK